MNTDNNHLCPPVSAGEIKKGEHVLLSGRPCKVVEIHKSKTGKHGHAKCRIMGICVLSGRKYEDSFPSHTMLNRAIIEKKKYQVVEIKEEFVDCLDEDNNLISVPVNNSFHSANSDDSTNESTDEIEVIYAPLIENNELVVESLIL